MRKYEDFPQISIVIGGIVNYYCSKILEYIKDRKIIRFFAFPQVCGVHVSIKQGKCIDT